ncbi:MAG TPA: glycosyltransferase family 8 protein [Thermoleophilaceae bacterium]|nr:glycosyltransferase family 8 protein [Thermoleophilaceae bacterium]
MATLHLSCAADRQYVPHAAAMLRSVLRLRGELDAAVHFLHGPRLPRRARRRLAGMVERLGAAIEFLEVPDERVEGLALFEGITPTMWYRVYLPELLPDVERVLYLDADVLAVAPLGPLWATDVDGWLLAAVTNVFPDHSAARARPAALGLSGPEQYFNSGVLLLNLDEMRRDGTSDKILDFARSNELLYPDQDALNAVMARRRLALHPRWNCMNSLFVYPWADEAFPTGQADEARRRPGIRHFEGPAENKPWHRDCGHEGRELYFEQRRETPWRRVRLTA